MTALEKAAKALAEGHGYDWELCPEVTREALKAEARAVLLAIREVDQSIVDTANGHLFDAGEPVAHAVTFVAVIDAILNLETHQ